MSSIRKVDRARITVKIHNMKRSASRAPGGERGDSPQPRMKRIRTSMDRYDHVSDSRHSPDRRRLRSQSVHPRYMTPSHSTHRDEFALAVLPRESCEPSVPERGHTFKVLCISSLHPKASDEYVKDTLHREFKRFGDFSVRIGREHDERVAYVCFRSSDVAREAKRLKPRIVLYDKSAMITVVYERPEQKYKPRSISPEYERSLTNYYQAPLTERRRAPTVDPYGRYAPHPPIPHREYRPPMNHHDYMAPRGPMMHHPPHMHPSHHHYVPRHPIRHVPPPHESKKDKFPNYLHHVQPEDDPQATRTLFAGNLEVNISEEELRRIFGKYGQLDDIDIKRPNPGSGNAFAFVRFENLDMAHRAKIELSGQYIGKFQCKIGYGKVNPTTRIWVGGLGSWTSLSQLEREFDRFGAIKKIEYKKGDTSAYIWYEAIEAAQEAVKEMRGYALGGPDRRLRIDYSGVPNGQTPKPKSPAPPEPNVYREPSQYDTYISRGAYRGRGRGRGSLFRGSYQYEPQRIIIEEERRRPLLALEYEPANNRPTPPNNTRPTPPNNARPTPPNNARPTPPSNARPTPPSNARPTPPSNARPTPPSNARPTAPSNARPTPSSNARPPLPNNATRMKRSQSRIRSPGPHTPDSEPDADTSPAELLGSAVSMADIARKSATLWTGALILKSSLFPAKLHLTDGDDDIATILMKDENGLHHLRITQRLRMDQSKLNDVQKRIRTSKSHAIFLALPSTGPTFIVHDNSVQTRPLRNLVSYLKQKEAAGVLPLLQKTAQTSGVLYAFPPCQFSSDLLRRTCHNLTDEALKEDYLVVVVVRGASVPSL